MIVLKNVIAIYFQYLWISYSFQNIYSKAFVLEKEHNHDKLWLNCSSKTIWQA